MNILDWLCQIIACEHEPDALNLDALEDALTILEARADENLAEYQQVQDDVDEVSQATLLEMAQILSELCGDLDAFLETLEFSHVRLAIQKAQDLVDMREGLKQNLDYAGATQVQFQAA